MTIGRPSHSHLTQFQLLDQFCRHPGIPPYYLTSALGYPCLAESPVKALCRQNYLSPLRISTIANKGTRIYLPTRKGILRAAAEQRQHPQYYVRSIGLSQARVNQLFRDIDRTYELYGLFGYLGTISDQTHWHLAQFDLEVDCDFPWDASASDLPFEATATLTGPNREWLTLGILYDMSLLPITHIHMTNWIGKYLKAYGDHAELIRKRELDFPILLFVAATAHRGEEWADELFNIARRERSPLPPIYVIDFLTLRKYYAGRPRWVRSHNAILPGQGYVLHTGASARSVPCRRLDSGSTDPSPLFLGQQGNPAGSTAATLWRQRPSTTRYSVTTLQLPRLKAPISPIPTRQELMAIGLHLQFGNKVMLRDLGHYPLFNEIELASIVYSPATKEERRESSKKLSRRIVPLVRMGLVHAISHSKGLPREIAAELRPADVLRVQAALKSERYPRYVLSHLGIAYLAHLAGYTRVEQYARECGWGNHFVNLIRNWEHSVLANQQMVRLLKAARKHSDTAVYLSEIEGRLYYETRETQRKPYLMSFLPDGRVTYTHAGVTYELALELEVANASAKKVIRKFHMYFLADTGHAFGAGKPHMNVLIIVPDISRLNIYRKLMINEFAGQPGHHNLLNFYLATYRAYAEYKPNDTQSAHEEHVSDDTHSVYGEHGPDAKIWVRVNSQSRMVPEITYCYLPMFGPKVADKVPRTNQPTYNSADHS